MHPRIVSRVLTSFLRIGVYASRTLFVRYVNYANYTRFLVRSYVRSETKRTILYYTTKRLYLEAPISAHICVYDLIRLMTFDPKRQGPRRTCAHTRRQVVARERFRTGDGNLFRRRAGAGLSIKRTRCVFVTSAVRLPRI